MIDRNIKALEILMPMGGWSFDGEKVTIHDDGIVNGYRQPSDLDMDKALNKADVLLQIERLEVQADSARRRREAIATDDGKKWLVDINNQIRALRAQL